MVRLRVVCCISKPRDNYSGPSEGGGFLSFLILDKGIGPGICHILAVAVSGIDVLAVDGA